MFRQLDYQDRVLSTLDAYLDLLKDKKARADRVAALAARYRFRRAGTAATVLSPLPC